MTAAAAKAAAEALFGAYNSKQWFVFLLWASAIICAAPGPAGKFTPSTRNKLGVSRAPNND